MPDRPVSIGVVNPETWLFLQDVYDWLSARHRTTIFSSRGTSSPFFRARIDRFRLRRDLDAFMRTQDVTFFEWASSLLAEASHRPKTSPIVARLHRYELYQWADHVNWHAVDRVIFVSDAKRRDFISRFPDHSAKTVVIPEAVSLERFSFTPRSFGATLGTLGYITPRKRLYDLILALTPLLRARPDFRLRLAGGVVPEFVDYYDAIQKLVNELRLTGQVLFDVPCDRPWEWYRHVDIFISNSYSEGLQVAPMEAMATGCYTLSHAWDGAEELLPDDCLYLTNDELVAKVSHYAGLPDNERSRQRERMRALAVERFDQRRCCEQIEAVLRREAGFVA
jgi:glycosyltransferase involved in cell wall biosynthesis